MDFARLRSDVHGALSGAFSEQGEMLNRWVLMAETIDGEGVRVLNKLCSEDATSWDAIGMISAGLALYKAQANDDFEEE